MTSDADMQQAVADAVAHMERMESALRQIVLLSATGLSLDQISAGNMRHLIDRVGEIARAALRGDG